MRDTEYVCSRSRTYAKFAYLPNVYLYACYPCCRKRLKMPRRHIPSRKLHWTAF